MSLCDLAEILGKDHAASDISLIASAFLALPLYLKYERRQADIAILEAYDDPRKAESVLADIGMYDKAKILIILWAYRIIVMFAILATISFYPFVRAKIPPSLFIFLILLCSVLSVVSRLPVLSRAARFLSHYLFIVQVRLSLMIVRHIENAVFWVGVMLLAFSAYLSRFVSSCP